LEHLFAAWQKVSLSIAQASAVALMLDYDGTLTPIVGRPEEASLYPATRRLLAALTAKPRFSVAVISGRTLEDLRQRVGLAGLVLAGNHGLEVATPQGGFLHPAAVSSRPALMAIAVALREALRDIEGVLVEDKGLSLSLHYRQVNRSMVVLVGRRFRDVTAPYVRGGSVRITRGKKVYEVRPPVRWDKGLAIDWILNRCYNGVQGNILPIYVGDDVTDEDGFREVGRWHGVSVLVAGERRRSRAGYYLSSPAEVAEMVGRLTRTD
jgi:trehalose-phosphatase